MAYNPRNSPTVDSGSGDLMVVANYVWDTNALDWVTAVGSTTSGTNVTVTNASIAVTGTVTANAGTNLNTSALATQTTLASILTDLQAKADLAETQPVSGTFFQATQPVSIASMPSTPVTGTFWQATQPVSGTFWQATQPVSGTFWQATQPVSGTVTANPATYYGKTITYVSVAQGAAGTTELAAASASNKHKIIGGMLTMSLAGTLKFNDGTVDLTGPMTFAANGGMVVPESPVPFCETAATNRPMNLITTVGIANGVIAILTEA